MSKKDPLLEDAMWVNVFEGRALGMAAFDLRQTFFASNRRFAEMVGYAQDQIEPDNHWMEFMPSSWRDRTKTAWKKVQKRASFRNHQIEFVRPNGKSVTLLVNGGLLDKKNDGNHVIYLALMDVTTYRDAEEKAVKSGERVHEAADSFKRQLDSRTKDLNDARRELEQYRETVERLNDSIGILMDEVQQQRKNLEERIVLNFEKSILPIVETMREQNPPKSQEHLLDTLDFSIRNITSYFGVNVSRKGSELSPREVQICHMILQGKDSREIAETMGLSYQTVIVHRKNIRKKLGIKKSKLNLATFLQQNLDVQV